VIVEDSSDEVSAGSDEAGCSDDVSDEVSAGSDDEVSAG